MTNFLEVPVEVAARDSSLRGGMTPGRGKGGDAIMTVRFLIPLRSFRNDSQAWFGGVGGGVAAPYSPCLKTKCHSERLPQKKWGMMQ